MRSPLRTDLQPHPGRDLRSYLGTNFESPLGTGQGPLHVEAEVPYVCGLGFLPDMELGSPLGTGETGWGPLKAQIWCPFQAQIWVPSTHRSVYPVGTGQDLLLALAGVPYGHELGSPLGTDFGSISVSNMDPT